MRKYRGERTRRLARAAIAVSAGWLSLSAAAQSNSLRHMGSSPPRAAGAKEQRTTAQPPIWNGAKLRRPLAPPRDPENPPLNPVLQQSSLIAVELPAQEKIGVGDLVTIIVREDKRFKSDAKLESDKTWEVQSAFERWFRLNEDHRLVPTTFPDGAPGIQFDFENQYEGEGKLNRIDSLVTRIQASVVDVKPNGNLVLEAKKRITVDEEDQVVTLTGTCRSRDLTAQNSVLSTQVADLEIRVDHTGATRDASRRGWLMRLFDLLRPI